MFKKISDNYENVLSQLKCQNTVSPINFHVPQN